MRLRHLLPALLSALLPAADPWQDLPPAIGHLRLRSAAEITASSWSIGGETLDRDYARFAAWREHLGPLGAKHVRLQSGWARCEPQPGVWDWGWLDEIVDGCLAQGVRPWIGLGYGNPAYPGGGGKDLGAGLPTAPEALAAWDRYVAAIVRRYDGKVDTWEIWNEPNLRGANQAEAYTAFLLRTAAAVRAAQPRARIVAGAVAGVSAPYLLAMLEGVRTTGRLDLIDEISYHPYNPNPDASYPEVRKLREAVRAIDGRIALRQGENGCPSAKGSYGALANQDWSETTQAWWVARRMLGDAAHGIPSSIFGISDMHYRRDGAIVRNSKGLLETDATGAVRGRKPAYAVFQRIAALIDARHRLVPEAVRGDGLATAAFSGPDGALVAVWRPGALPAADPGWKAVSLPVGRLDLAEAVVVDLMDGSVRPLPAAADGLLPGVPVGLMPVVVAARRAVPLVR